MSDCVVPGGDHHYIGRSGPCTHCGVNCCAICGDPVDHGQLYVETRERDMFDEDSRLLAHVGCLGGAP